MSDTELYEHIRYDLQQGFRDLVATYQRPVYWHIRRLVVRHADTEDILQETFLRIFRSLHQLDNPGALRSWVYQIATHEALRYLNKQQRRLALQEYRAELPTQPQADAYFDYSDIEVVRLQNAIRRLPRMQQVVFNLRYYDELSYDDIAQITQSTATGAKANYHLAKNRIIEYMTSHD
jgi:RNA polymerase sigma-70 factor (ECF subfamily)